ncbi:MAG: right-handed parallel beta-helix repeat-containing protein, partial [Thermoplasmata archaeon]|nr:right-handed parallel beta-helix repeat-containing protein [Thermoplasmata archaeon]
PVHYWKNVTGGSIPLDAGEAILANCTNVIVQNLDVSNGTVGVETGFSSWNTIVNNTASLNDLAGILVDNSHDTTIYNNTALTNHKYGVYVHLSKDISIIRNNASGNRDGIFLYDQSDNNVIVDNIMSSNSGSGAYILNTDNNTVADNTVIGNGMDGVSIWSSTNIMVLNTTMVENGVYVRGELLEHWNTHIIASNSINGKPVVYWKNITGGTVPPGAGQIILANCVNIVVDRQNVSDGTAGIEAGHSQWITITNNTAVSNSREGIFLSHTSNVTIAQNNASHNMHGIYTYYESYYLDVIDNILSNNSGVGLRSGYFWSGKTYYSVFENNTISSNVEEGLHVQGDFNDIINNLATNNMHGIYLQRSTGLNVTWNTVSGNDFGINFRGDIFNSLAAHNNLTDNGLSFRVAYSDFNVIANNTINKSWDDGFYLFGSDSNTIIDNMVMDSAVYGIEVDYSNFNMIYHNDFVFNMLQAYDDTGTNIWDNGYPSGGNFWSDYNGTDNMSGPNQDQPGSDGIGDTPYNITGDSSQDRYPLMNVTLPIFETPSAPLNLTAGAGDGEVYLSWDPPLDDGGLSVRKYRIYRGNTSGGETFLIEIGDVDTYTDAGLTNGQTYFYQVSAVNAAGEGPLSNEANATPKGPPGSPGMIGAELTGLWYEDVTVTWALSSDDGAGQNSVVSYEIYRNTTFDPDGLGYGLLASVPNGTTSYTDMWAGEPDMDSHFYRICALDKFGIESCSGTQASKFTRYIVRGMNLVSFPVIPANDDSATILQTVYHDESWVYDSLRKTWRSSVAMKPYSQSLGPVNHTMGMWIS